MVKKLLIDFLHFVRAILEIIFSFFERLRYIFFKHVWPLGQPEREYFPKTVFMIYEEDQIKKSYEYFKKFFSKTIFLRHDMIKIHALKNALINDKNFDYYYLEFGVLGEIR